MYELMGRAHAAIVRGQRGQGTVEYVGLVLLMGVILAAVVAVGGQNLTDNGIPAAIVSKLKKAISDL
jgi:hypothetical protein